MSYMFKWCIALLLLSYSMTAQDSSAVNRLDSTMVKNLNIGFAHPDSAKTDTSKIKTGIVAQPAQPGKVEVFSSGKIQQLVYLHQKTNKENCPRLVKGYRVQIFSYAGKDAISKATKVYNQFLIAYPDVPAYMPFEVPSHKVKVGDCRTRLEAEQIKAKIQEDFRHAFIVPDYITSPYQIDCEDMEIK